MEIVILVLLVLIYFFGALVCFLIEAYEGFFRALIIATLWPVIAWKELRRYKLNWRKVPAYILDQVKDGFDYIKEY